MTARVRNDRIHALTTLDDSGLTTVAQCKCGKAWITYGPHRIQDATYQHALHAYDHALTQRQGKPGKGAWPTPPNPEDYAA